MANEKRSRRPGRRAARQGRYVAVAVATLALVGAARANGVLNLPETPLFVAGSKTALVQLVVQRDNNLFFEAYPSYEDIDGDGAVDIRYKPDQIDYTGYFEPTFCYAAASGVLTPVQRAVDKKCLIDTASWSGDFLNYLTMTRMDIVLRALYGGRRSVDEDGKTVLRRAFVPGDNHTWGIEYASTAIDGFDIADYSPLAQPLAGKRHQLATNNLIRASATSDKKKEKAAMGEVPYLFVRENRDGTDRIWDWVETERTQGHGDIDREIVVDVEVCKTGFLETSCKRYPNGNRKPVGLLHDYGEDDSMYFSLVTGSYENNLRGGILRQSMSSFGQEIDQNSGRFEHAIGMDEDEAPGIVATLDAIRIPNDYKDGTVQKDCGFRTDRPFKNGECRAWGNPLAEMMYEGMRYLAGSEAPTSAFDTDGKLDGELGLGNADWDDPYSIEQPYGQCSSAYQLVISDPSPSFDGDQLPGSSFPDGKSSSFTGSTLGDLHVGDLADTISSHEDALPGLKFIGEANGVGAGKGSPAPKQVTTLRTARGLAPEAPHRQGSYYAPSVAYHGHRSDVNPNAPGRQSVGNFALALGSPLPTIDVDVAGKTVSFAPFAKTVGGCSYKKDYSPVDAIVGFSVETLTPTSGRFRVAFEDLEQGNDNDMDALVRYEYAVSGGSVTMTLTSIEASGCLEQHLGYSVSGTTADGVYLVVRDADTDAKKDDDFPLDVPPGASPGTGWEDDEPLPLESTIAFTPSAAPAAETLESPLWYAAKWGGFDDRNGDGLPQRAEWDENGDGVPDNFFEVTNPGQMSETMRRVFDRIEELSGAATSVGVTGGALHDGSRVYDTSFESSDWSGELVSRAISATGEVAARADWSANASLAGQIADDARQILTWKPSTGTGIPFRWPDDPYDPSATELDREQALALSTDPISGDVDRSGVQGSRRLAYVRGEEQEGMRERDEPLGDIVHSSPQLVGPPAYRYPDDWGEDAPESTHLYSAFARTYASRPRAVFVGANDGMLHAFDAGRRQADGEWTVGTGKELFAYVPGAVLGELPALTSPSYTHKYYVDATPRVGDALLDGRWRTVLVGGLGRGGQGVYALDVTDLDTIGESRAASTVLWELTERDDADLGFTFESPLIVRLHDGEWAAVLSSGYNSAARDGHVGDGRPYLFFLDLETGAVKRKIAIGGDLDGTPHALAPPTAADLDGDGIVDIVYAGDLRGNVWKFDVRSSDPDEWAVIASEPLYTATDGAGRPQPITTALAVGRHPTGAGVLVYAGTGKYLETADANASPTRHRVYALWDEEPFEQAGLMDQGLGTTLLEQSITGETTRGFDVDGDGTADTLDAIRTSTQRAIDWTTRRGWYIDLTYSTHHGEQIITAPQLREDRLLVSTHLPGGDACAPGREGWLMLLDAASGAMPATAVDVDGDGRFTTGETLSGIASVGNPFAPITVVSGAVEDVILSSSATGAGAAGTLLDASTPLGRVSWRELAP